MIRLARDPVLPVERSPRLFGSSPRRRDRCSWRRRRGSRET